MKRRTNKRAFTLIGQKDHDQSNGAKQSGFTLIELIVVMAILAILVLLAAPKLLGYSDKARTTQIRSDIKVLESKIDEYLINHDGFPDSFMNGIPGDGQLYDRTGKIDTAPDNLKVVDTTFYPETSLGGDFFSDKDGNVIYEDEKIIGDNQPGVVCAINLDNVVTRDLINLDWATLSNTYWLEYYGYDYVQRDDTDGKRLYENWFYFIDKDYNEVPDMKQVYRVDLDDDNWFYIQLEIVPDVYTVNESSSSFNNFTQGLIATIISKDEICGSETPMITYDGDLYIEVTANEAERTYKVDIIDDNKEVQLASQTFEYIGIPESEEVVFTGDLPDIGKEFVSETVSGNNDVIPEGSGTSSNPYKIAYLEHLLYMNDEPSAHFVLTRDLSFNNDGSYLDVAANKVNWTTGTGWTPLNEFSGVFDGQNHGLYNLFIERPSESDVALFSSGNNAQVSNLLLNDAYVSAGDYAGILFGSTYYDLPGDYTLSKIGVSGEIKGYGNLGSIAGYISIWDETINLSVEEIKSETKIDINSSNVYSYYSIGGVFGESYGAHLDTIDSHVDISIINPNAVTIDHVGGISGLSMGNLSSYNNLNITGQIRIEAQGNVVYIGGVAGGISADGNPDGGLEISNVFSSVGIDLNLTNGLGWIQKIGGIAGYIEDINLSNINNSGHITIAGNSEYMKYVGGISGNMKGVSSISGSIPKSASNLNSSGNININANLIRNKNYDNPTLQAIGGIAGDIADMNIENVHHSGSLIINVTTDSSNYNVVKSIGGVAGHIFRNYSTSGLSAAYLISSGNVNITANVNNGSVNSFGGITGFMVGMKSVDKLYYSGSLKVVTPGTIKPMFVGGVAGNVSSLYNNVAQTQYFNNISVKNNPETEGSYKGSVFGAIDNASYSLITNLDYPWRYSPKGN